MKEKSDHSINSFTQGTHNHRKSKIDQKKKNVAHFKGTGRRRKKPEVRTAESEKAYEQ
jgi:hypothetical protein